MSCGRLSPSRGGVRIQTAGQRLEGVSKKAVLSGAKPGCPCRGVSWGGFVWGRPHFVSGIRQGRGYAGHTKDEKKPLEGAFCLRAGYAVGLVFVVQIVGVRRKRTSVNELANLLNDDG